MKEFRHTKNVKTSTTCIGCHIKKRVIDDDDGGGVGIGCSSLKEELYSTQAGLPDPKSKT